MRSQRLPPATAAAYQVPRRADFPLPQIKSGAVPSGQMAAANEPADTG